MIEIEKDRRLSILLFLKEVRGRTSNNKVLQRVLKKSYGHAVSSLGVESALEFLAEKNLVKIEALKECKSFWVVTLTDLGLDVANGDMVIEGVQEPLY